MADLRTDHNDAFWKSLLDARAIDASCIQDVRDSVNARPWKRLGAILIELGYVNIRQVSRLLRLQADAMHLRIGELAVQEGYCTPRELGLAIQTQMQVNTTVLESLFEHEDVDRSLLLRALSSYVLDLERQASRPRSGAVAS